MHLDPPLDSPPAADAIRAAGAVVLAALAGYAAAAALDDWPALMLASLGAMLGASLAITRIVGRDLDAEAPRPLPENWTPRALGIKLRSPRDRRGARLALHGVIVLLAASAQVAGRLEEPRLLGATLALGGVWYLLFRATVDLAAPPEPFALDASGLSHEPGHEPAGAAGDTPATAADRPARRAVPPEPCRETTALAPAGSPGGLQAPGSAPGAADIAPPSVFPPLFQAAASLLAVTLLYAAVAADNAWLWRPTSWDDFQGPLLFVLLEAVSAPVAAVAARQGT